jgi:hypothetical protein
MTQFFFRRVRALLRAVLLFLDAMSDAPSFTHTLFLS